MDIAHVAYQESPTRQALVQMANYNKFLEGLTTVVRALGTLDPDHQTLAYETMGRLMRLEKGIVEPNQPWRD